MLLIFASFLTFSCDEIVDDILTDPGDLIDYRGNNGLTYEFRVTGDSNGDIWGGLDGYYTDDSDLSTAAVHAGALNAGETDVVKVIIRPGRNEYFGCTQNGVTSGDWTSYYGSYEFDLE